MSWRPDSRALGVDRSGCISKVATDSRAMTDTRSGVAVRQASGVAGDRIQELFFNTHLWTLYRLYSFQQVLEYPDLGGEPDDRLWTQAGKSCNDGKRFVDRPI